MRKLVTNILAISASALLMFCSGKDGASGPAGSAGTNGKDGVSNIITLKKSTTSIGWTIDGTFAVFNLPTPEITQSIIDNGGVDVKVFSSGASINLPFVSGNANINYAYELGNVSIAYMACSGFIITNASNLPNFEYKITIIPQK